MSAADPTAAIAAYLKSQIGTLVSNRVFRPELPRSEDEFMPRECIVVRPAGGYQLFGGGSLPVGDTRIDVLAFASSQLASQNIARAALIALKNLGASEWEHTLLYWARLSGGGVLPLVDPETLWPCSLVTAQVMHAEVALA